MNKKKYPCIMQHDSSDCAAAVVATILKKYGSENSILKLREILCTDYSGTTIKGIINGLENLNFSSVAIKVDLNDITKEITLPAIARIKILDLGYHFVVIHKVDIKKRTILVADPARGLYKTSFDEFINLYTNVLILCCPKSSYEEKSENTKGLFEIFSSLILPQKKLILITIVASLILTIFGLLLSSMSKIIVDEIIPYNLKDKLIVFGFVFGLCVVLKTILEVFRQYIILFLSRKIDIPVMLGYFDHIINLPYEFFINRRIGDIITRFQDAATIKEIFTSASISLVLDIVLSIISAFILWNINNQLFLVFVIIILLDIILVYLFKKPYKKINLQKMEAAAELNSNIIESLKNFETVKSNNCQSQQIKIMEEKLVSALRVGYKEGKIQIWHNSFSDMIISIGNIVFMFLGAYFIIDRKMTLGDLLFFQTLSAYFTEPVQNLVGFQISLQEAQIAIKRLNELMQLKREEDVKTKIDNLSFEGDIVFKNVGFSYGSRKPVLKNFNLTIKYGDKIGIIGESGSGKSTIARLLLKFIISQEGDIRINGIPIKNLELHKLRNRVAYIPQNMELFRGTILENLLIGNEGCSFEDVIQICDKLNLTEFINKMSSGFYSIVEEDGANISGGEKQRLIIARALLKNPDIIILDEATSNLDAFNEQLVQDLIYKELCDKTVIIIAHRLSAITNCDHIYLISDGQVNSSGKHEQLIKTNSQYEQMVILQSIK